LPSPPQAPHTQSKRAARCRTALCYVLPGQRDQKRTRTPKRTPHSEPLMLVASSGARKLE
jgi:hypothetical protein